MSGDGHAFGIVRVRPASAEAEGPSPASLDRLINILLPEEDAKHESVTIPFPLDSSPLDDKLVEHLTVQLRKQLDNAPNLLVDFCYDRTIECYGILEWILYRSLTALDIENEHAVRIYIYMEILPGPGERLFMLSPTMNGRSNIAFIDADGTTLGFDEGEAADTEASLGEYFSDYNRELPKLFKRRLLRRRGVFGATTTSHIYYKYQYALRGTYVQRELIELLLAFFAERSISSVVYSDADSAAPWLEECIVDSANRSGIPWASLQSLDFDPAALDPALQPIVRSVEDSLRAEQDGPTCLLLPAYKNGRGYADLYAACARYGEDNFVPLVIIMDEEKTHGDVANNGWYGTITIPIGRESHVIHYLCSAPIIQLERAHWSVQAALALGEIETPDIVRTDLRTVGIWSFLHDHPIGIEEPTPKGREPIRWFPLLQKIDDWDSLWIAAALFDAAMAAMECNSPSTVLVVIPDECNASAKIAQALEHRLGVAVVRVPRDVLEGTAELPDKDKLLISSFAALRIVAVDESSVTGGTLDQMSELVKKFRGNAVDLRISLFQISSNPATPKNHRSLFQWEPYLTGERHGRG